MTFMLILFSLNLVFAHENFNETKKLIDSGISCSKLNNNQLEEMGDYYMEQMHPGESHEMMHKMMGGEDSETTKLMHTNMAKSIYCGETNQGMMGMMSMMMKGGINNMYGGGMMSGVGYSYGWNVYSLLYLILLVGLIVLVVLIIIKLLSDLTEKKKK